MIKIISILISISIISTAFSDVITCKPVNNNDVKNHVIKIINGSTLEVWYQNRRLSTHNDVCSNNKSEEELKCKWHSTRDVTVSMFNMTGYLNTYNFDRILLNCTF